MLRQAQADSLPLGILDATQLIPEVLYPIEVVGRMVLDRNPDKFFAETEQAAFLPTKVPRGSTSRRIGCCRAGRFHIRTPNCHALAR